VSRFIRVKTFQPSEGSSYLPEFAYINLDTITHIREFPIKFPGDESKCIVHFTAAGGQTVYMPAEALIAIIERKEGKQP
jgi:hypothetical protein